MTKATIVAICFALAGSASATSPDLVLHDAYSLHRGGLDALLLDHHYRTIDRSTPWIGAWPAPVLDRQIAPADTQAWLRYDDTVQQRRALVHPLLGLNYRSELTGPSITSRGNTDLSAFVVEGGGILSADAPDFHAWGDARISVERQEPYPHSYDGQFIEPSEDGGNSIATYTSFARFEGRMTFDTRLGRFGAGRTRQQWGPSYLYPLVLSQETQPYSQIDWTMTWGDFRIRTLWGQLAIDGEGGLRHDTASRSIYAHRYEWTPSRWFSLGASEVLILYKTQEPIAFVPIVPLFMMKGQSVEDYANGELAFDVNIRPMGGWRLYGEFLVDDMSEPVSLFSDYWKNKWAFTVGSHAAFEPLPSLDVGFVAELSRVEPWVYTEYVPSSNQAVHQGLPLGNQSGPNSLSLGGVGYAAYRDLAVSTGVQWIRKGTDSGSSIADARPESSQARKKFLDESSDHLILKAGVSYAMLGHAEVWLQTTWSVLDELDCSARQLATFRAGVSWWM